MAKVVAGVCSIGGARTALEKAVGARRSPESDNCHRRGDRSVYRRECRPSWSRRRPVGDLPDRRDASGMGCWSGASAVIPRRATVETRPAMQRADSPTFANALRGRRVAVVGMGYVGLPTALSLAGHGAEIIGCDVSESRLTEIKSGRADLLDRDRARLTRHLQGELIKLTTEPTSVSSAEVIVICVPTPIDAHQTPDLTALSAACGSVVDNASVGQTIVLTSTTYVGCTRALLVRPLQARGLEVGRDVFVAFSPERSIPVLRLIPLTRRRGLSLGPPRRPLSAMEVLRHSASTMYCDSSPNWPRCRSCWRTPSGR